MADGGKASWWKSMTMKKKPKEPTDKGAGQENVQFPTDKTTARENKHPNLMEDKEYLEKGFSEKNTRRNLKISRSGRFKEKHRVRATLPESTTFFEGTANGNTNDDN